MSAAAPPTSNDRVIAGSLPCIRCGYDLDKCPVCGRCPECGEPASLSLDSLWLEETEYIRTLRRGVTAMTIGAVIGPSVYVIGVVVLMLSRRPATTNDLAPIAAIALISGPVLATIGAWMFTHPRAERPTWSARLQPLARLLAVAFSVCFVIAVIVMAMATVGRTPLSEELVLGIVLATGETWCFRNFVLLAHIRALAQVSNQPRTSRIVPIAQIWCGVIALGGLAMAAVLLMKPVPRFDLPTAVYISLSIAYGAWIIATLAWLVIWPILLSRFAFGLKKIIRHHGLRGRPTIVAIDSAPSPPAPPTTADPPPHTP